MGGFFACPCTVMHEQSSLTVRSPPPTQASSFTRVPPRQTWKRALHGAAVLSHWGQCKSVIPEWLHPRPLWGVGEDWESRGCEEIGLAPKQGFQGIAAWAAMWGQH